jgi:hypothetical protein
VTYVLDTDLLNLLERGNAEAAPLDATLLTRNLSDFRKVPGLHVEDWSAE